MADKYIIKNGLQVRDGTIEIGKATVDGYIFPTLDGSSGQALVTDGNGNISFQNITATPGGSTTQIQYNNGGAFAGDTGFTTDGAGNVAVNGQLTVDDITIDGSTITGVGGSNGDIILDPTGAGLVLTTSGYDMSSGPDFALATKGYVDSLAGGLIKYERLRIVYNSGSSTPNSIDSTTSGISATISGTQIIVTFTGYNWPPLAACVYGYIRAGTNNVYKFKMIDDQFAAQQSDFQGGGVEGSPVIFGGLTTQTLALIADKTRTRASADLGESTHAWFMFMMIA